MTHDQRNRTDYGDEYDDLEDDGFERIRKGPRASFPTSNERKARRSSKETQASKKVRKSVSSQGGMHRRRRKRVV